MSDDLIKSIQELIDSGKGDLVRLNYILNTLKQGKPLFSSDQKYLDNLILECARKDGIENFTSKKETSSVEELRNEIKGLNEKLEKINEKQKPDQIKKELGKYKSMGKTVALSFSLGLLGFYGIGHIYVGKIRRGIAFLIGGTVFIYFFFDIINGGKSVMLLNEYIGKIIPAKSPPAYDATMYDTGITIMIILIGSYIVFFLVQILDACRLCKKYNKHVDQYSKRPW